MALPHVRQPGGPQRPPPHLHELHEELLAVLDALPILLGRRVVRCPTGGCRGRLHAARVPEWTKTQVTPSPVVLPQAPSRLPRRRRRGTARTFLPFMAKPAPLPKDANGFASGATPGAPAAPAATRMTGRREMSSSMAAACADWER
jgi:hypothetical protein